MIDFFTLPNPSDPLDEWWGFSIQHGWVILDRNIPNNKTNNLVFLRCLDWQHYADTKQNWNNTKLYNGANYYIKSLPNEKKELAIAELEKFKGNNKKKEVYEKLRSEFEKKYLDQIEKKHKTFMEGLNLPAVSLRKNTNGRRVNHCYNCKRTVDNSKDLECTNCNWIVCGLCGACGCGYSPG